MTSTADYLSEETWRADFDKVAAALEPWVFDADGAQFISDHAPQELVRVHKALTLMGYARGWL